MLNKGGIALRRKLRCGVATQSRRGGGIGYCDDADEALDGPQAVGEAEDPYWLSSFLFLFLLNEATKGD